MDEVPGLQFNTPTKKNNSSRLLLSNGRPALPDKLVADTADFDQNQHQHPCSMPPFYA